MTSKSVIVVGASRGIGLAIARKFVEQGNNVTLVSRNRTNLELSAGHLREICVQNQIPVDVDYNVCDVSNESDINLTCQSLIDSHALKKKPIDILVNSAGVTYNKLLITSTSEQIRNVLDINLVGTIMFTKLISKQMIRQKSGAIINIGSIIGQIGSTGLSVYSASKAALVGFTKSLAKELGPRGITANIITPGYIDTDMTANSITEDQLKRIQKLIPLQRIGSPEDVANVAYFLSSSPYITGSVVSVDGGVSLSI